ncbi:MAG: hypothetical protein KR126chlam3_01259 [Chlamydiae bacterium]|nr:hypothetical protein [Chlamydiota bacterium]
MGLIKGISSKIQVFLNRRAGDLSGDRKLVQRDERTNQIISGILKLLDSIKNESVMKDEDRLMFMGLKMLLPSDLRDDYSKHLKTNKLDLITSANQILPFFEQFTHQ